MSKTKAHETGRTLMQRVRMKVLAILLGTVLAAVATISLTSLPAWPIVGVAVATVAVAVNKMTARLKTPVCYGCGEDITRLPSGEYGVICPSCGMMTPKALVALPRTRDDQSPPASA